jgi:3-oxoacyl-[acyl-carrier protein] reductase
MDFGIKGKVAIVTGTNKKGALGCDIATTLAAEGVNIACVDLMVEEAEAIANDLLEMGVNAKAYKVDQRDYKQVAETVARIKEDLGPPEILINNAILLRGSGRIESTSVEDWQRLIKIELDGPWYWIREVWESMVNQKWGRIINISSISGVLGGFGQVNYSAAKAGVIVMAKTAALEGARLGITANAVTIGVVDTSEGRINGVEMFQRIKARIAMHEFGEPADISNCVAFLASKQAKYITGQNIHVMGGLDLFTY